MLKWVWLCSTLAIFAGGCTSLPTVGSGNVSTELSFAYQAVGGDGNIDQTLEIRNPGEDSVTPVLSFLALDRNDNVLRGVEVTTVFGSDRGRLMVPRESAVFDILRFSGPGASEVEGVDVNVETVDVVAGVSMVYPDVEYLDAQGDPVDRPWQAETFRVSNPGEHAYVVRLVGIVWGKPPPGRPQQADEVITLSGAVTIAAGSSVDIPTNTAARRRIGSAKAYISSG